MNSPTSRCSEDGKHGCTHPKLQQEVDITAIKFIILQKFSIKSNKLHKHINRVKRGYLTNELKNRLANDASLADRKGQGEKKCIRIIYADMCNNDLVVMTQKSLKIYMDNR